MENLYLNEYRKRNVTSGWLARNKFYHSRIYSTKDSEAWEYRFPCYHYGDTVTLMGSIVVYEDGFVKLNCYDAGFGGRSLYAPFYCAQDWDNNHEVLEVVTKRFNNELKRLGIKLKKEWHNE